MGEGRWIDNCNPFSHGSYVRLRKQMLKKRHNDLGVGHDGQCGAARGMQEGLCAIPGLGTFSP